VQIVRNKHFLLLLQDVARIFLDVVLPVAAPKPLAMVISWLTKSTNSGIINKPEKGSFRISGKYEIVATTQDILLKKMQREARQEKKSSH